MILFIEGFDHYSNFANQFDGKWNQSQKTDLAEGRQGIGKCLLLEGSRPGAFSGGTEQSSDPAFVIKSIQTDNRTGHASEPYLSSIRIGFAVKFDNFPTTAPIPLVVFANEYGFVGSGHEGSIGGFYLNSAGEILYSTYRNPHLGLQGVIFSSTESLVKGKWHYVELYLKPRATTTGEIEVHIDGGAAGSATGLVTSGANDDYANPDRVSLFRLESWVEGMYIDDLYIMDPDDTGADGLARVGFLGDQKVLTAVPNSDVATAFNPLTGGTNYAEVDDASPDDATTYNASDVVGAKDIFGHTALNIAEGSVINGAQVTVRGTKNDTATRKVLPLIVEGGVEGDALSQPLSTTYRYRTQVYERNPNGDVDWTPESIDSANIGYKGE